MLEFTISTKKKFEVLDITKEIKTLIKDKEGKACFIFLPHATAALSIGEFEPNIKEDYENALRNLLPNLDYKHNHIDNNAEAHILSALIKPSLIIPMDGGKLMLGTWQSILLFELDGPRQRRILVDVLG